MSSTARLGAFIFGSLVILGLAIFIIGGRQFLFSRTYRLQSPFDTVAGLEIGAPVRAGGVRVGTVTNILLPHQAGEKVMVEMELGVSTRDVIKKDSIATIDTEGLLGNKYLTVSFGSAESAPVSDGDTIESEPPIDYADIARKAGELLDVGKAAIDNVNVATDDLKSITGKINSGEGTIGALVNDKQMYNSLNATADQARQTVIAARGGAVSFSENMEALKHNWLLRGFFKKRGYYDSTDLTEHAVAELPKRAAAKQFGFNDPDLFAKPDTAKLKKEKLLDQVGRYLEQNPFNMAVIVSHAGAQGEKGENLKLTQARAMVVRQYLARKFKLDDARLKTKGLGEADPRRAGRLEVLVYADNQTASVQK